MFQGQIARFSNKAHTFIQIINHSMYFYISSISHKPALVNIDFLNDY